MRHSTIVLRHFETLKNTLDIHGTSSLTQITKRGREQLRRAAKHLNGFRFVEAVTCFPTPQAGKSARLLADALKLPFEPPLDFRPYDLGVADGVSNEELQRISPISAQSLALFRERVINANLLEIEGGETTQELEKRFLEWWKQEGQRRSKNRIIVGSSSTALILSNFFNGILPTSGNYFCFYMPNGSFNIWRNIADSKLRRSKAIKSWPDIRSLRIPTEKGFIQTSIHYASWGQKQGTCIIAPGYFGNSRQGPYALYSRLARELAKQGYETHTIDYLGSGESTPISRSFETDLFSLLEISKYLSNKRLILIGHSMGAAVVAAAINKLPHSVGLALAPIVSFEAMRQILLSSAELEKLAQTGGVARRGVLITRKYLRKAGEAWLEFSPLLEMTIAPAFDSYDPKQLDTRSIASKHLMFIANTDHNFSTGDGALHLTKSLLAFLENKYDLADAEEDLENDKNE